MCLGEAGRWVLTGVVAGGYGCADPSSPALYTRVSRFSSWIDEVINTRAHQEEPHTQEEQEKTNEDLTHVDNDLTHTHSEGKDKYLHVHSKHTHEQQQHKNVETNEINEIKHTHAHHTHTNQHVNTHTMSSHTHHVGDADTNTQILV